MAKAPRAKVSQTSGQGVSRLSYQKGRQLGNYGKNTAPGVNTKFETSKSSSRNYVKGGKYPAGINVSYGDTIHPTDLDDINASFLQKPPKARKK